MAILFMDGFEALGTLEGPSNPVTDELNRNYSVSVSGDNFFLRPDSNSTDKCLSFGSTSGAANSRISWEFGQDVIGQEIIIGLRFKTRDHEGGASEQSLIEINGDGPGSTARHLVLIVDYPNDRLVLRRGNTLIDNTSSSILASNTWYHVEFKFVIDDSPSGSYDVQLDGSSVMSDTSVDTRENTTTQAQALAFTIWGVASDGSDDIAAEFAIDDLYVLDATGGVNDDFLGENTRVRTVFPTSNGTTNDFTASSGDNYTTVDDNPVSEADYNDGSTNGDIDEYGYDSIDETTIYGVMVSNSIKPATLPGLRTARNRCRSGATVENGDDAIIADSYEIRTAFDVDPNTAAAWTQSNLNSAEFGVEVRD